MDTQGNPNSHHDLEKENTYFLTSNFLQETVIRTVWHWHKKRTYKVQKEPPICSSTAFPPGTRPNKQIRAIRLTPCRDNVRMRQDRPSVTTKGPQQRKEALRPGIYLSFLLAESRILNTANEANRDGAFLDTSN